MPRVSQSAHQASAKHARETGQALRVRVSSGSMAPVLQTGDAILVRPCAPEAVHPGDVLTVQSRGSWITHRLMEITPRGWVLMGDASPWADAPLPPGALVGRVEGVWRGDAFQDWRSPPWQHITRAAARRALRRYAVVRLLQRGRYPPRGVFALLLRVWKHLWYNPSQEQYTRSLKEVL